MRIISLEALAARNVRDQKCRSSILKRGQKCYGKVPQAEVAPGSENLRAGRPDVLVLLAPGAKPRRCSLIV
jgi:hypothetical protein